MLGDRISSSGATSQRGRWGDRSLGALPSFGEMPAALVPALGADSASGGVARPAEPEGRGRAAAGPRRAARPGLAMQARHAGRLGLGSGRVSGRWSRAPLSPGRAAAVSSALFPAALRSRAALPAPRGCSAPGLLSLQVAPLARSRLLLLLGTQRQSDARTLPSSSPSRFPVPRLSLLHSG